MSLFPDMDKEPPTADAILGSAIEAHNPSHVFAMFSGGHDSLCAAAVAARHPRFTGCVHINTGIGIEETRQFVRDSCDRQGWPLLEYRAAENTNAKGEADPQIYEEVVLKYGFPGAPQHGRMYNRLKERQLRRLIRDHRVGAKDRIMLVTGVRRQESRVRMGRVEEVQREGSRVWCAPLMYWSGSDVSRFVDAHGFERNIVKDLLHISGECLCGAMADIAGGERKAIATFFPEVDAQITDLERRAAERGVWCKWGHKPPLTVRNEAKGQTAMLCSSCQWRQDKSDGQQRHL